MTDPLQGLRAMVVVKAVDVAEAALEWERSSGAVPEAMTLRLRAQEYAETKRIYETMKAQVEESQR